MSALDKFKKNIPYLLFMLAFLGFLILWIVLGSDIYNNYYNFTFEDLTNETFIIGVILILPFLLYTLVKKKED